MEFFDIVTTFLAGGLAGMVLTIYGVISDERFLDVSRETSDASDYGDGWDAGFEAGYLTAMEDGKND